MLDRLPTIKTQLTSGAKWTSLSTIGITLIQIIQFWILGNTLSVSDFGIIGLLTTLLIFLQIILDLGLGSAVIQKENVTHKQLSTLFWINIFVGIILFVILHFGSPLFARYFGEKELSQAIQLLAFLFLIAPIGQQAQYLMQKDLDFRTIGKIEVASTLISFICLLIFLNTDIIRAIQAFVLSQVVLYSLKGMLYFWLYRKKWVPGFLWDFNECKVFFSFGIFQLLSRLVNRVGSNLDVLLVGRFLGMEALGIYSLVYQIVTIPVLKINPILTRVAFPLFSKVQQDNKALVDGYLYITKILGFVSFPLLLGLLSVSDLFIALFFGEKWIDAVPILQIMLVVGLLRVLMNPNGSIILAKGKANIAFYWDAGVMILYGLSLLIAVQTGSLVTVAWTYVGVSGLNFIFGRWLLAKLIFLQWKDYIKALTVPLIMAVVITILAFVLKISMGHFSNHILWTFIASVGISTFVYVMLVRLLLLNKTRLIDKTS